MISLTSFAKINLHLHITGRKDNGYHALDSLVAFADFSDKIHLAESSTYELHVKGDPVITQKLATDCPIDQNIVTRAVSLLAAQQKIPPRGLVTLEKYIPPGTGLGGGSSNAATVLLGLPTLWNKNISYNDLRDIASQLGSDISCCLTAPTPVIIRDTGNILYPAPQLPTLPTLLVIPPSPCETPAVYKTYAAAPHRFSESIDFPDHFPDATSLCHFLNTQTRNDLTKAAITVNPDLTHVLQALESLPDPLLVRLSGSGSACYAIFATDTHLQDHKERLLKLYPGWKVIACKILPSPQSHETRADR